MATTSYGSPYVSGSDLVAAWPAASLTVANAIDAAGYYIGRGINAQTASYTGVLTDAGKTVTMTNAGATTFTVPANASVAYPTGTRINILNLGAGACTPTAGAGVTINGTITALATNESASLVKTATNTWSYLVAATPAAPGLSLVTPTSVAGTGVTLSGGKVSFSAATSVSVNGCFTSTYDNYEIILEGVASTAGAMDLRLRVSGTDASGADYNLQQLQGQAATPGSASVVSATNFTTVFASSTTVMVGCVMLCRPNLAQTTMMTSTGGRETYVAVRSGYHNTTTQYDGFTFIPTAGNVTGTLRVYGLRNS
jgi:hypothetical protein